MQVHFRVLGADMAPSLRSLVEQHFRLAAYPFRSALDSVHVTFSEIASAGASVRKRCQAVLRLRDGRRLTIDVQDARTEKVVHRAAKRIVRTLRRCRPAEHTASLGFRLETHSAHN